ncbi:multidrug transporter [Taibaiella soli]|uniref:Multidrug transporter n=1 Tax=Taibaiella soli TaxID=1649169 RepID=A0A2W2B113_9BACT|nr:multidrug transporter [Taibaiella soli]
MAKSSKPAPKYRDADTGQYTSKDYADKNPKTTVKETDKPKTPPKKK